LDNIIQFCIYTSIKLFIYAACAAGYFGDFCEKYCLPGTFGENCGGTCSPDCAEEDCDRVKGCLLKGTDTTSVAFPGILWNYHCSWGTNVRGFVGSPLPTI
jgi:hypothetical protein